MKTSVTFAFGLILGCTVALQASAQTPPALAIGLYAGLSITGVVAKVYTVQYTTDLTESNDWRGVAIVQLPSSPSLWVDTNATAAGRRFYRAVEGPTNLCWIPPGTFTMGAPSTEAERGLFEGPQTVVTLAQGFFMGKYEVTQGDYLDVIGSNPSYFRNGTSVTNNSGAVDVVTNELRHPVERVSWMNATNYCARLTERERAAGRIPAGWVYRLPTEAEWEYACRAGTTTAFHFGPALLSGMANFRGIDEYDSSIGTITNLSGIWLEQTSVVGSYQPNGWGLYDMHGNVFEWCLDWDSDSLPGGRVTDPQGPATGSGRIIRGGSWFYFGSICRSSFRQFRSNPGALGASSSVGFRVVLTSPGF